MNIDLSPELEQIVHKQVESGRYHSASEMVSEALRLIEKRDELLAARRNEIEDQIAQGYESLQRGEGIAGEEFFKQLAKKSQARRIALDAKS